jgi:hypothetical protein
LSDFSSYGNSDASSDVIGFGDEGNDACIVVVSFFIDLEDRKPKTRLN